MNKDRRLGRGLEALLGRPEQSAGDADRPPEQPLEADDCERVLRLDIYSIDGSPYQPRQEFDQASLQSLSENLMNHGLQQPIVVRQHEGRYQLISGERRLRAAILAGWTEIPALVREANDRHSAELAIVENLQREDLSPLEKAMSFVRYMDKYGCTQDELAARIQVGRGTIANLIRLLELPQSVQEAVRTGALSPSHARALLPLGEVHQQAALAKQICDEDLSVRAVEDIVREILEADDVPPPLDPASPSGPSTPASSAAPAARPRIARTPAETASPHIADLELEFRRALGTKVEIKQQSRRRGRIIIHFKGTDEFDRLRTHITGDPPSDDMQAAG